MNSSRDAPLQNIGVLQCASLLLPTSSLKPITALLASGVEKIWLLAVEGPLIAEVPLAEHEHVRFSRIAKGGRNTRFRPKADIIYDTSANPAEAGFVRYLDSLNRRTAGLSYCPRDMDPPAWRPGIIRRRSLALYVLSDRLFQGTRNYWLSCFRVRLNRVRRYPIRPRI